MQKFIQMDHRPKCENYGCNSPRGKHKGKSLQTSSDQRSQIEHKNNEP